jgi:hypothetical protein
MSSLSISISWIFAISILASASSLTKSASLSLVSAFSREMSLSFISLAISVAAFMLLSAALIEDKSGIYFSSILIIPVA